MVSLLPLRRMEVGAKWSNLGIVSAPLWDSKTSTFAGLLTTSDYINLIQYYWQNPDAVNRIDQFKLNSLRGMSARRSFRHGSLTEEADIEKAIGVSPLETASIHPLKPLYEACRRMLETRARRIPLVDIDDETGRAMVVSVVTQYRILKFVAVNVHETQLLRKPLRHLNLGTYKNLETAKMETPVFDVIHQLVNCNISSVPILNSDGKSVLGIILLDADKVGVVTNVFEAVDVITLIKGANYDELNLNVGEALQKRSEVCNPFQAGMTLAQQFYYRISQGSTHAPLKTGWIPSLIPFVNHEFTVSSSLTKTAG